LNISNRIAARMGGRIEVQSSPGEGSVFTLHLPLDTVSESSEAPQDAVHAVTAQPDNLVNRRVLAVDDGPENLRIFRFYLEEMGLAVSEAVHGEDAVQQVKQARDENRPFDIVLMDIRMPVMDGLEATQTLRQEGFTQPILAVTASAMRDERDRALRAGCNDYLTKPVNPEQLRHLLAKHLPGTPEASHEPDTQDTSTNRIPLRSERAEEAGFSPLLEMYAEDLEEHARLLRVALDEEDWEELREVAHRLKGSGGSYGYPAISETGRRLQDALVDGVKDRAEVKALLDELLGLVNRAIAGIR
jgi:CheY-like chemotaxis protein/HPt (histidine-containing phosphotransfer) domain-containing protein